MDNEIADGMPIGLVKSQAYLHSPGQNHVPCGFQFLPSHYGLNTHSTAQLKNQIGEFLLQLIQPKLYLQEFFGQ